MLPGGRYIALVRPAHFRCGCELLPLFGDGAWGWGLGTEGACQIRTGMKTAGGEREAAAVPQGVTQEFKAFERRELSILLCSIVLSTPGQQTELVGGCAGGLCCPTRTPVDLLQPHLFWETRASLRCTLLHVSIPTP